MSGKGGKAYWGGKGKGKGGKKHYSSKRHRVKRHITNAVAGIKNPSLQRLARRGGVKRISGLVYAEMRGVLKGFLHNVVKDAVVMTESSSSDRKTVQARDIIYALKRQGRSLFGFGDP